MKQNYDYILIDCPPSLGIVTTNAFLAADEIIVPMTPELLPLKGMRMLDSFVSTLQRVKPNLRLGGVSVRTSPWQNRQAAVRASLNTTLSRTERRTIKH
ncbi:Sporulation initiation inhibitor protein soj [Segatella copri]|nr:Sporulation initiation inhibitor protein soj [Segatella copri]